MLNKKDSRTGFCIFLAQNFLVCSASNTQNPWRQKKYIHKYYRYPPTFLYLLSYSIFGLILDIERGG